MRGFGNYGWLTLVRPALALLVVCITIRTAQSKSIFDDDYTPQSHGGTPASAPAPRTPPPAPVPPPARPTLNPEPPKPEPATPDPAKPAVTPPALSPNQPDAPKEKLAPPDAAARAKAVQQVKKVYDDLYARSTAEARRNLAQAMVDEAPKISRNFPAKYVLLVEAIRLASATRGVEVCQKAVAELDSSFVVDRVALITDALKKLTDSGADDTAVVTWAMEAVDTAIQADEYRAAHTILTELSHSSGRDPALRARIKAKADLLAEADRVRPAFDKLKTAPEDPIANFRAGKFLCFLKHDWAKGLPYLARGSDPKLAALARADLAIVDDPKTKFALAGKWWELGDDKIHSSMQASLHERAGYWYGQVVGQLTDLDKAMAERRISAAATVKSSSPGNILTQMIVMDTTPTVVGGDIELKGGRLKAPADVAVPFRADVVAKTDSQIRLGFMEAEIIFNWQDAKDKLYVGDPVAGQGRPSIFTGKGEIPVNTFVTLTWVVQEDGAHIFVDGKERATVPGSFKGLRGPFYVISKFKAVISVRSVAITSAPPTGGH